MTERFSRAGSFDPTLAERRGGKRWSRDNGYKGYTSYASLNDLPRRDPAFADLRRILTRHGIADAKELGVGPETEARQPVGQSVETRWAS